MELPHDRLAPRAVLAGLRDISPHADLIHLTWDRWLLVTFDGDDTLKASGRRVFAQTEQAVRGFCARHPGVDPRAVDRITVGLKTALLKAMGARTVGIYVTRDPSSAIVLDYKRADFLARHNTDADFWRAYDAPLDRQRAEALKDLTDDGRARDAWRHAFTLNHHVGGHLTATAIPDHSSTRRVIRTLS